MAHPTYNPDEPAIAQTSDWSCAVTSARWGMTAFGRQPTQQWIEETSLAEGVESRDLGLMDATGAGLAAFITRQYAEYGYSAYNVAFVTFNDVIQVAGLSPVLIGGRDWAHWVGVRRYDQQTGTLALANPADGYMGVGQSLDRQQFASLGAFSMVVIEWHDPAGPPGQTPTPSADVAALQARVAELTAERDRLVVTLADVIDRRGDLLAGYAAAIQAVVETERADREQTIGPRP